MDRAVRGENVYKVLVFILVLLGALIMIYPLIWMIVSSFKPELLIFKDKSLIIREFTLENYTRGFEGVGGVSFLEYMLNSMKVVIPVIIGNLISCSMVGYAVARLEFSFKKAVIPVILITMMLPVHATLVPRYMMFRVFGWLNTYLPLTVPSFFAM